MSADTDSGDDDGLPPIEVLETLSRNELRALASARNLPADQDRRSKELLHHLKRVKQGGRVMVCPGCGYTWVYLGEQNRRQTNFETEKKVTSCPQCKSSVTIGRNTVWPPEATADADE